MLHKGDLIVCLGPADYSFARGDQTTVVAAPGDIEYDMHQFSNASQGILIALAGNTRGWWVPQCRWRKAYEYENMEPHQGGEHG